MSQLVSFVVLNWNGLDNTLLCLESLRKQTYKDCEIIVVDNGSRPDQRDPLRQIPDITLIEFPKNTGFTGGHIAGLKASKGAYVALVNNDCVLAPDWAEKAVAILAGSRKKAAVGGKAFLWNDAVFPAYDTENEFYSYQVVDTRTGHTTTLKTGHSQVSVNSISGSAVLISKKALQETGYFDNRFFAYYEETDLFARLKRAGYTVVFDPSLHTWHKIAQSTKGNPSFYLYHMHRNRFMYALKNFDRIGPFLRDYTADWWRSAWYSATRPKQQALEQRAKVKAGIWNLVHLGPTLAKRTAVQKLGPSYFATLEHDAGTDLTIVIPCYNYANYVAEAIESAAKQSLPPQKIIIIDDGSKDNSLEVINQTVARLSTETDVEFEVVSQENSGTVATKNRAIDLVQTVWTIFLDADDILHKDYVKQCRTAQAETSADVVYTDMQMFGASDNLQTMLPYNKYRLRSVNFIHNSSLFRTSLLKAVGGYSKFMSIGFEDWEINIKLSRLTDRFTYLPKPLLLYRRHEGASRDSHAQQKYTKVVKLLENHHPDLYNLRYYLWVETRRALDSARLIAGYPYRSAKHIYHHTIIGLTRKSAHSKKAAAALKTIQKVRGK
jgi:GT2 family glycosyltransferase